jgi:hypothetical protein
MDTSTTPTRLPHAAIGKTLGPFQTSPLSEACTPRLGPHTRDGSPRRPSGSPMFRLAVLETPSFAEGSTKRSCCSTFDVSGALAHNDAAAIAYDESTSELALPQSSIAYAYKAVCSPVSSVQASASACVCLSESSLLAGSCEASGKSLSVCMSISDVDTRHEGVGTAEQAAACSPPLDSIVRPSEIAASPLTASAQKLVSNEDLGHEQQHGGVSVVHRRTTGAPHQRGRAWKRVARVEGAASGGHQASHRPHVDHKCAQLCQQDADAGVNEAGDIPSVRDACVGTDKCAQLERDTRTSAPASDAAVLQRGAGKQRGQQNRDRPRSVCISSFRVQDSLKLAERADGPCAKAAPFTDPAAVVPARPHQGATAAPSVHHLGSSSLQDFSRCHNRVRSGNSLQPSHRRHHPRPSSLNSSLPRQPPGVAQPRNRRMPPPSGAWLPACCADDCSTMFQPPQPFLSRHRSLSVKQPRSLSKPPNLFAHFEQCLPQALPAAQVARLQSVGSLPTKPCSSALSDAKFVSAAPLHVSMRPGQESMASPNDLTKQFSAWPAYSCSGQGTASLRGAQDTSPPVLAHACAPGLQQVHFVELQDRAQLHAVHTHQNVPPEVLPDRPLSAVPGNSTEQPATQVCDCFDPSLYSSMIFCAGQQAAEAEQSCGCLDSSHEKGRRQSSVKEHTVERLPAYGARLRLQAREHVPHSHDRLFNGFQPWLEVSYFTLKVCHVAWSFSACVLPCACPSVPARMLLEEATMLRWIKIIVVTSPRSLHGKSGPLRKDGNKLCCHAGGQAAGSKLARCLRVGCSAIACKGTRWCHRILHWQGWLSQQQQ